MWVKCELSIFRFPYFTRDAFALHSARIFFFIVTHAFRILTRRRKSYFPTLSGAILRNIVRHSAIGKIFNKITFAERCVYGILNETDITVRFGSAYSILRFSAYASRRGRPSTHISLNYESLPRERNPPSQFVSPGHDISPRVAF